MSVCIIDVDSKVAEVRGTKVLLDCDVASLYGGATKEVNQAVRNNPDKFPEGYLISLKNNGKEEVVKNFDHLRSLKYSHTQIMRKSGEIITHHFFPDNGGKNARS